VQSTIVLSGIHFTAHVIECLYYLCYSVIYYCFFLFFYSVFISPLLGIHFSAHGRLNYTLPLRYTNLTLFFPPASSKIPSASSDQPVPTTRDRDEALSMLFFVVIFFQISTRSINFPAHSSVGVPHSNRLRIADTEVHILLVILAELCYNSFLRVWCLLNICGAW
jgi:hypothetical protein